MALRGLTVGALACAGALIAGCGPAPGPSAPGGAAPGQAAAAPAPYASDASAWGRFHSRRFHLTVPLPDGRAWKIDDHGARELVAVHAATDSRLSLLVTSEAELVNRQACEARARKLGFVPDGALSTVEDEVVVGPGAYDARLWVAVAPGAPGAPTLGHVLLFGAHVRRCLFVHLATGVPSSEHEEVLASRLATAATRIVQGIRLDPPRTTGDARAPRSER